MKHVCIVHCLAQFQFNEFQLLEHPRCSGTFSDMALLASWRPNRCTTAWAVSSRCHRPEMLLQPTSDPIKALLTTHSFNVAGQHFGTRNGFVWFFQDAHVGVWHGDFKAQERWRKQLATTDCSPSKSCTVQLASAILGGNKFGLSNSLLIEMCDFNPCFLFVEFPS